MNTKSNRLLIALVGFSVLFSQTALAARIGGGRSSGMQRSISKPMNNTNYTKQTTQPIQQQAQPQRQGMGAGTGALLGAAAGAAGGYMLGKSMANDNNSSTEANKSTNVAQNDANTNTTNTAQAKSDSNIPWGIIAILVALLVIGLAIFRKKSAPQLAQPNNNNNNFKIPSINQNNNKKQMNGQQTGQNGFFGGNKQQEQITPTTVERMPDGIEPQYFLRQAKGMFLHIQSMNTPENVVEIEKYMTTELYNELKTDVANNKFIADFSQLNCQLLECDNSTPEQILATVQFDGMVSEEPGKTSVKFNEIWHFTKNNIANAKWIVAGIQQNGTVT